MDLTELVPRLHFLRFPVGHAYLWEDPDGLTLVDSGLPGSAESIAEAVRTAGYHPSDVRRVVLTHFHGDHIGSAGEAVAWGSATVYAHRADAEVIRGRAAGAPPNLLDWEKPIHEQVASGLPDTATPTVGVDREVDDGEILDFGDGARVVAAPGHTPGSIAIHLPRHRVLFTGDAVARAHDGRVIVGVFNVDPALAAESFKKLALIDADIACFGHGEPLTEDASGQMAAVAEHLPL